MTAVVTAETHAEFAPPTAPARLSEIKVKGAAAIAVRLTRISVLNARTAAVKGIAATSPPFRPSSVPILRASLPSTPRWPPKRTSPRPGPNTGRSTSAFLSSLCRAARPMWWCTVVPALLGSQIQLVAKLVMGDPILLRVLRPPHPVVKFVTGDSILPRVERGVTVSTAAPTARAPQRATLGAALITWLVPSSR